jgi:hypothetical protein
MGCHNGPRGRRSARRAQHRPSLASVLAALVPLALDMRGSPSSSNMSTAWSAGMKALTFVVLAYLARRYWPGSRRRHRERSPRRGRGEHEVQPREVQPTDVPVDRSRVDGIKALQRRVRASSSLPLSVRIELRQVLESLRRCDADDANALAAWQRLRNAAPEIWDASTTILDALMGESARRALEADSDRTRL